MPKKYLHTLDIDTSLFIQLLKTLLKNMDLYSTLIDLTTFNTNSTITNHNNKNVSRNTLKFIWRTVSRVHDL